MMVECYQRKKANYVMIYGNDLRARIFLSEKSILTFTYLPKHLNIFPSG